MPKEKTQGNVTVQSQNDNATQRVPENEKKDSAVLHLWQRGIAYVCPACTQEQPWVLE